MKLRTILVSVVAALLPNSILSQVRAVDVPDGQRWWSHVSVLADDKLEGRNTGSAGHRKAAEYVAAEFAQLGLKPAGTDGYLQPVHLISSDDRRKPLEPHADQGSRT